MGLFDIFTPSEGEGRPLSERRRAKGRFEDLDPEVPWTEMDLYPGRHFDLPSIWESIGQARQDSEFQRNARECRDPEEEGGIHPTAEIAMADTAEADEEIKAERVLDFFRIRIPEKAKKPWDNIVEPFLEEVEKRLNEMIPQKFPGILEFGWAENGSFGLFYFECAGAKAAKK